MFYKLVLLTGAMVGLHGCTLFSPAPLQEKIQWSPQSQIEKTILVKARYTGGPKEAKVNEKIFEGAEYHRYHLVHYHTPQAIEVTPVITEKDKDKEKKLPSYTLSPESNFSILFTLQRGEKKYEGICIHECTSDTEARYLLIGEDKSFDGHIYTLPNPEKSQIHYFSKERYSANIKSLEKKQKQLKKEPKKYITYLYKGIEEDGKVSLQSTWSIVNGEEYMGFYRLDDNEPLDIEELNQLTLKVKVLDKEKELIQYHLSK